MIKALTERELEILKQVCSNRKIALDLGISLSTVKNHFHMIYKKLGTTKYPPTARRTMAVIKAIKLDLFSLTDIEIERRCRL